MGKKSKGEASAYVDAEQAAKAERKAAKAAKRAAKAAKAEGWVNPGPAMAEAVEAERVERHGKKKAKASELSTAGTEEATTPATPGPDALYAIAVALDPATAAPAEPEQPALTIAPVQPEVERDQWGRPYVITPDGSRKGYRRVTTYIDVLEDKTALSDYGRRMVLTGVALDYGKPNDGAEMIIDRALDAVREADAELARLDSLAAGGDLVGVNREAVERRRKDALNALAAEAYDVAGGSAKAQKGTDLHALTELVDQGLPLPEGLSAADLADLEAYQATVKALGITFTDRERFVVNDELETGGTLDRAGLYRSKRLGWSRARRVVMDIKTGRLDYSAGKIGMQLATYARSEAYDLATGERTPLKLDRKLGLLIHLPAGQGTCQVYEVDLELAYRGLLLAREVYAWRRDGKRVYDLKAPLQPADVEQVAA